METRFASHMPSDRASVQRVLRTPRMRGGSETTIFFLRNILQQDSKQKGLGKRGHWVEEAMWPLALQLIHSGSSILSLISLVPVL
ncbi:hypothetical protein TNCV_3474961 [Trichonephila clavipes]|nr:hypothetical protein TNCV_3474961 [Trichonephila clavipes]